MQVIRTRTALFPVLWPPWYLAVVHVAAHKCNMLAPNFAMYGKELFSVHARFVGDSDRNSDPGDRGLRGYTEKT